MSDGETLTWADTRRKLRSIEMNEWYTKGKYVDEKKALCLVYVCTLMYIYLFISRTSVQSLYNSTLWIYSAWAASECYLIKDL